MYAPRCFFFVQHTKWEMQEAPNSGKGKMEPLSIVSRLRFCSHFSMVFEKYVLEGSTYFSTDLSISSLSSSYLTEVAQAFLTKTKTQFSIACDLNSQMN